MIVEANIDILGILKPLSSALAQCQDFDNSARLDEVIESIEHLCGAEQRDLVAAFEKALQEAARENVTKTL